MINDRTIERVEDKYLILKSEKSALLKKIRNHIEKDKYFKEKVLSLYFDTDTSELANRSIDRPEFREKIRLRAYNIPTIDSTVFLEVKSKLAVGGLKIGDKRRLAIPLKDFYEYFEQGTKLETIVKRNPEIESQQVQVARELDYLVKYYGLKPKVLISTSRTAYVGKDCKTFRLTFDENLRFRTTNLKLERGAKGERFFDSVESPKNVVMEVKTIDSMPLWFTRELAYFNLYPSRFSKYGKIYQLITERNK